MTTPTLDWPQSAALLLEQAKQRGDVVKLILSGVGHIDSWLIEHSILPFLAEKQVGTIQFAMKGSDGENDTASIVPLPDGTAFACNTAGLWMTLEASEALHEIEYIGYRLAPSDHWHAGFTVRLQVADAAPANISPVEIARRWQKITGKKPKGFEEGAMDQIKAFGIDTMGKLIHSQGRLGL